MAWILKNNCTDCGKEIVVSFYKGDNAYQYFSDYGTCIGCLKITILPNELIGNFTRENCIWTDEII